MQINQAAKKIFSRIFCNSVTGHIVGRVWPNRIPSIRGGRYVVRRSGFPAFQKASILFGTFEEPERAAVSRYLHSDLDTLELGSGIGYISCSIARKLSPDRQLVIVEPDCDAVALTRDNLRHNSPNAQVKVINAMVDYSSQISVSAYGSFTATEAERKVLPVVTLRDLVDRYFKGEYQLVMDIEGSELGLILKEKEALSACKLIIAELHSSRAEGKLFHDHDMIRVLAEYGFTNCRRLGIGANYIITRNQ